MTGLTLATAGLTLGIGLLVAGVMWWANESKKAKEAFADALDNSQKLNDEVKSLENLAKKQEELTKIENKSTEQKEELLKVQKELAQVYPELATGIDEEGNKIAENLKMTKQLTEEKRKLLEQELLVIKTTADTRLPQLRQELADMQDEAQRIQDKLTSGDVYETSWVEGYEYQIDVTEDLKNKLLELVNAQKENHEETTKLENGVKSYNQILEENAERHKWTRAEELESQTRQLQEIEEELKSLGFTSDEVAQIMSGNLDKVKDKHNLLTEAQIENYKSIETLSEAEYKWATNRLKNDAEVTRVAIKNARARINAIKSEIEALTGRSTEKSAFLQSLYPSDLYSPDMADMKSAIKDITSMGIIGASLASYRAREIRAMDVEVQKHQEHLNSINQALGNLEKVEVTSGSGVSGTKDPKKAHHPHLHPLKKKNIKQRLMHMLRLT